MFGLVDIVGEFAVAAVDLLSPNDGLMAFDCSNLFDISSFNGLDVQRLSLCLCKLDFRIKILPHQQQLCILRCSLCNV